jgi:transcriptional regulator with XRE-family HTH domain
MKDRVNQVHCQIADRIRGLRAAQGLSLDGLAAKSGVSRSMISVIERGESSPTAVVLDKLAGALGVTLAALFDAPKTMPQPPSSPVARCKDQPEWQDPDSGYIRRNVSPSGVPQPVQISEVHFPPGARVAFDNAARNVRFYQQIWMLKGTMEITIGKERHRLCEGDCLAMQLDVPTRFHNPTRKPARYAVVIASELSPR